MEAVRQIINSELTDAEKLTKLIKEKIASGEIEVVDYDVNEKGQVIIDKDKHPDMYDWAVNG